MSDPFAPPEVVEDMPDWAFMFRIMVDDEIAADLWGPSSKRDWLFNALAANITKFKDEGIVRVMRRTNGEWRNCDDWRKLTH